MTVGCVLGFDLGLRVRLLAGTGLGRREGRRTLEFGNLRSYDFGFPRLLHAKRCQTKSFAKMDWISAVKTYPLQLL